jgi:osmotically-inducible protein OsmY
MKTDAQLKDDVTDELRSDPQISDEVSDRTARLYGQVHSLQEATAAQAAAASPPGVASVESHLVIAP